MRYLFMIVVICTLPLFSLITGCGDSPEGKIVVLPDGDRSVACVIQDDRPIPIQELPFPSTAAVPAETRRPLNAQDSMRVIASAFDLIDYNDNGWITYLAAMGTVVMVLKHDPDSGVTRHEDIHLPEGYAASALAIVDDIMYIGCREGAELLGYYDLASDNPAWVSMDVPDSIRKYVISVGGLVINRDQLIAVTTCNFEPATIDYIEYGRVILTYDISNPERPMLLETVRAPGPNPRKKEWILKTVAGSRWVATLSDSRPTWGRGYVKHITVYEMVTLSEYAIISNVEEAALRAAFQNEDMSEFLIWESIGMLDDILLVAARDRGIAIFDPSQIDTAMTRRRMMDKSAENLKYQKFIAYPESKYLNFMPVPALDKIAAVISRDDSLNHILLSTDELLTPDLWIDNWRLTYGVKNVSYNRYYITGTCRIHMNTLYPRRGI